MRRQKKNIVIREGKLNNTDSQQMCAELQDLET